MKTLYIIFADIRGHTEWADSHSPSELAELLKKFYFIPSGKCVLTNVSSDMMVLFYSNIVDAIKAAKELRAFGHNLLQKEYDLSLGISLHKGEVTKLEFTKNKISYDTYVGHSMCVGKRMESLCYGGDIIISDIVYDELSEEDKKDFTIAKEVRLKGVKDPMEIHLSVA